MKRKQALQGCNHAEGYPGGLRVPKELKKENSRKNLDRRNATESKRPLQKELRTVEAGIQNIVKAITSFGPDFSSTFAAELRQLQLRKNALAVQLDVSAEPLTLVVPNDLRKYVSAKMEDLRTLLLGDRPAAKQAIQQYIGKLTLTPVQGLDGRQTYSVNGAISPFSGPDTVMPLVAPQGFEPRDGYRCRNCIGCPPGIRTPIERVRVASPTIEREGNTGFTAAAGSAGATISRLCECTGDASTGQPPSTPINDPSVPLALL